MPRLAPSAAWALPPRPRRSEDALAGRPAGNQPALYEGLVPLRGGNLGPWPSDRGTCHLRSVNSPGGAAAGSRRGKPPGSHPPPGRGAEDLNPRISDHELDPPQFARASRSRRAGLGLVTDSPLSAGRRATDATRRHAQALAAVARIQPPRQVHGGKSKTVRGARLRSRSPSWVSISSGCRWITVAGQTARARRH